MTNLHSITSNQGTNQIFEKKQSFFIGKSCLIAGFIFAIIFAISYVLSNFIFLKNNIDLNYLILIGSISLIVSLIFSMIISFRGMRASFGLIFITIIIYSCSFILMFSTYFSILGNSIMFYALVFTAISIFIIGAISFLIPAKIATSLLKISFFAIGAYFLISISGSLIIWFVSETTFEIWQIILTSLIGLVIMFSTIYSFYSLRKTNEYINIISIDKNTYNKLLLLQSFNILSSIMVIFMWILRILGFFRR